MVDFIGNEVKEGDRVIAVHYGKWLHTGTVQKITPKMAQIVFDGLSYPLRKTSNQFMVIKDGEGKV